AAGGSGDRFRKLEPVDPELTDVNVESGQDRLRLAQARPQLRKPKQGDPRRLDAVDVQDIVEPGGGRPVEVDLRSDGEGAPRVRDRHVAKRRLPEQRAIDPSDP